MSSQLSPLKTIVHAPTGRMLKMGRLRPPPPSERRMFVPASPYLQALAPQLPPRPSKTDHARLAARVLAQMLMNDQLGDCTVAGMFHLEGTFLANAGQPDAQIPNSLVQAVYRRSGWIPGQPNTDQGWDEVAALESWHTHGLGIGKPIAGWLSADPTNVEEMKTLIWLFENLYFGVELPDAWVNPGPSGSGFRWDVAGDADESNGHCFVGVDYDDATDGVVIDSWGMTGLLTWAAIARYCVPSVYGEVHCVITTDMLLKATKKAPSGVDWAELVAKFDALGGNVDPLRHLIA